MSAENKPDYESMLRSLLEGLEFQDIDDIMLSDEDNIKLLAIRYTEIVKGIKQKADAFDLVLMDIGANDNGI